MPSQRVSSTNPEKWAKPKRRFKGWVPNFDVQACQPYNPKWGALKAAYAIDKPINPKKPKRPMTPNAIAAPSPDQGKRCLPFLH